MRPDATDPTSTDPTAVEPYAAEDRSTSGARGVAHRSPVRRSYFSRRDFLASSAVLAGAAATTSVFAQSATARRKGTRLINASGLKAIESGLHFLVDRQNEGGWFGTGDYSQNVAVCGLCGMALLAQGSTPQRGRYAVALSRCLEFLLSRANESGLIHGGEQAGREPMYGHGFAMLFLAEVYGTSNHLVRDKLSRAVQLTIRSQNGEGGWRYEPRPYEADVSVTVCQVMALRAARNAGIFVPNDTIDRSVAYLKKAQNPDGGFMYMLTHPGESSFPRSAAAIVALMSAGLYDEVEVQRGIEYLQKSITPLKSLSGHSYLLYGHYYAAQAMWHVGGDRWNTWYPPVRDFLVAHQERNGSWIEAISPEYSTAMACLILQMPNNYLPIFQR